jgi:hypothetical protein
VKREKKIRKTLLIKICVEKIYEEGGVEEDMVARCVRSFKTDGGQSMEKEQK